ncbi:DUF6090 family protein [Polaribacter sp.]|uniref:DUF6090 family protein n=1 Tax=Polaribacter sp. TaxID=1920175 RepID=UPI004047E0F1
MIKFFRKIRQNLLMENKTSKYFKYAIGEIVLVVIGILIALQINNWNENRKLKKQETKILSDLLAESKQNKTEIQNGMKFIKITINDISKIEYYINNNLDYSTELDNGFCRFPHNSSGAVNSAAYNSLKSIGIGILQNDKLKMDIVNLYDVKFLNIPDYTIDENLIRSSVVFPFYAKNIIYSEDFTYLARPNNFTELKRNQEFLNILRLVKRQRIRGVERLEEVLIPVNKLIQDLSNELDSKLKL